MNKKLAGQEVWRWISLVGILGVIWGLAKEQHPSLAAEVINLEPWELMILTGGFGVAWGVGTGRLQA